MKSPSKSILYTCTLILVSLFSNVLVGQNFSKIYYTTASRDYGNAVVQTNDGGYATIGYTSGVTGNGDVLLLKLDAFGVKEWYEVFGHTSTKQEGFDLKQSADGSFLITGYSHSGNFNEDIYLIKTDSDGNLLWEYVYNIPENQRGHKLLELSNGDIIISGSATLSGIEYAFILRTDSFGNTIWSSLHLGEARGIAEAPNGDILMVGKVISTAGDENALMVRLDASGNLVWEKEVGGAYNDVSNDIVTLTNGNFAVTGYTETGPADYLKDLYVLVMDINGNFLSVQTHGLANKPEHGNSIVQSTDGGFVVAGRTGLCDNWGDMYLLKFDAKVGLEWEHCYGGPPNNQDEAYDVNLTNDGGYVVSGRANGYTPHDDLYIIKTGSDGIAPPISLLDIVALDPFIGKKEIAAIFEFNEYYDEKLSIAIFDLNGRQLDYKEYNSMLSIQENNNLPLGVYLYRIIDENGELLKQGKLLIE